MADINLSITPRQRDFVRAEATEVLFGGAAGGGKSYGQLIDALLFALRYPRSRQIILRRTYRDLELSIIRQMLALYPRELRGRSDYKYTYSSTSHVGTFANGSTIDFGYCDADNDVYQYQGAEYDVIRFDELTHFAESQYLYLISRLRGANGYPKHIKSSTNPGGVGHSWVKARFIDPSPPNTVFRGEDGGTRIFLPSLLTDNHFLMASDPGYKQRLEVLPDVQKRALLYGEWDLFEGRYFTQWRPSVHVIDPPRIDPSWRRYRSIDYGLDRLDCIWWAVAPDGSVIAYKELSESNLIISDAAAKIIEMTGDDTVYATLAPPDMWSRSQETGRSKADIFAASGVPLTKTSNDREAGWLALHELIKYTDDTPPRMRVSRACADLIKYIPMLQIDPKRPTDVLTEPHAITHAPDSARAFAIFWVHPNDQPEDKGTSVWTDDMIEDYYRASSDEQDMLIRRWGKPINL